MIWVRPGASPTAANVSQAWGLLVKAGGTINPVEYEPLNYDIVNTGREVLAQLITTFEQNLTSAVAAGDKTTAMETVRPHNTNTTIDQAPAWITNVNFAQFVPLQLEFEGCLLRDCLRIQGAILLEAYTDLDDLIGCDWSFLIGPWIADATKWANATDAPENYYEWMARSQVSTWWPVAPSDAAGKHTANSQHNSQHKLTPMDLSE